MESGAGVLKSVGRESEEASRKASRKGYVWTVDKAHVLDPEWDLSRRFVLAHKPFWKHAA